MNLLLALAPLVAGTAHSQEQTLDQYMLELINHEREMAGLQPVSLGNDMAAQQHAENMLEHCYLSNWGLDGMKPYMRYNGTGVNAENVSGLDYCINDLFVPVSPFQDLEEIMNGFMNSPGHRDNILNEHHTHVNLGISHDDYNMRVVQHFEYSYVTFTEASINGTTLTLSGHSMNVIDSISLCYDPLPYNLTRGQVERTYCYDNGVIVASIIPPHGYYYMESEMYVTRCPDPYDVDQDAPASQTPFDTITWRPEYHEELVIIPFIEAIQWEDDFSIISDITPILEQHGPGVYTALLFGDDIIIGQSTIFVE